MQGWIILNKEKNTSYSLPNVLLDGTQQIASLLDEAGNWAGRSVNQLSDI